MSKTSTTISLTSLPAVDVLKKSLVYVATNRVDEGVRLMQLSSTDKIRKYAKIARQLSAKKCFFCEKERQKSKLKENEWEGYDLCECLAPLTKGYREHYPWQMRLAELPSLLASGTVDPSTIAYSDDCVEDGKRFSITVGQVARAYQKHTQYRRATRCLECVQKLREANKEKGLKAARKAAAKQVKKRMHGHAPAPQPQPLQASIAEQLSAKETLPTAMPQA